MGSSESSLPPTGPLILESQSRDRDVSMFLPFLLTLDESDPDPDQTDNSENPSPNSNPENRNPASDGSDPARRRGDRIMLINPLTQGMVVIEGANLRSILGNIPTKSEQRPASKASIEAMPTVEVTEKEEGECPICLDEWKAAEEQDSGGCGVVVAVVKQMPCKHRFHGECIEKWLGIHGSCPVCRFRMPSEDEDDEKKSDDGEAEDDDDDDGGGDTGRRTRRRWGGQRGIWVSFRFGSRRRDSDRDDDSDSDEGLSLN